MMVTLALMLNAWLTVKPEITLLKQNLLIETRRSASSEQKYQYDNNKRAVCNIFYIFMVF